MSEAVVTAALDTLLNGRGKARTQAEAALRAADPLLVLRAGLPLLPDAKAPVLAGLLTEAAAVSDVATALPDVLAAIARTSRRLNYWETDLPKVLSPFVREPAVQARLAALLLAPEKKAGVAQRGGAADLLGQSGAPLALRALATRSRRDRGRPGGFEATTDRVLERMVGAVATTPPPAPWRERVVYALATVNDASVWPTLLLEAAAPLRANDLNLWEGIARTGGEGALPWIERKFSADARYATRPLALVGTAEARAWLRGLTEHTERSVRLQAALELLGLEGEAARPWLIGALHSAGRPTGSIDEFWWKTAMSRANGWDPIEPRVGLLPGETCPLSPRCDDSGLRHLALTEAEQAALDAQERAFVLTDREIAAL